MTQGDINHFVERLRFTERDLTETADWIREAKGGISALNALDHALDQVRVAMRAAYFMELQKDK